MMEASSTTGMDKTPVLTVASTTATSSPSLVASSNTSATGAPASVPAQNAAPSSPGRSFQVPQVLKDKADDLTNRIATVDIKRINGYMRFANLIGAILLCGTCIIRMFSSRSYSDFLVIIYLITMTAGLLFIENHEMFPPITEKVKMNFGFMFTAIGKTGYIVAIAFLAFSQGWIGSCLGVFFLILAAFNFLLIYRHPAYQEAMTSSNSQPADVESMPELRYNQAPVAQAVPAKAAHVVV